MDDLGNSNAVKALVVGSEHDLRTLNPENQQQSALRSTSL